MGRTVIDPQTLATYSLTEVEATIAAMRGAWIQIDLGAIAANVRALRDWLPSHTHLMAVVKADGYGHGAMEVAQTALGAGADWLGVATVAEGLKMRAQGFTQPILLLGLLAPAALPAAIGADLQITVGSAEALAQIAVAARALGVQAKVHLKVDTGMTRVGAPLDEAAELVAMAVGDPHLELVGLESHLATAESAEPAYALQQIERFDVLDRRLELPAHVLRHLANSAGTLFFPQAHYSMVRPGLLLYGIPPRPDAVLPFPLRRAMTLTARLTQVRTVAAGVPVGYGGSFVTCRRSRLAILPVGYADGLPRALSNRQSVLIGGVRCPIVGNVSMDQCTVDVTDAQADVGAEAVLLGEQGGDFIGVEEWAEAALSIPYEVICGLGRRLPKVHLS